MIRTPWMRYGVIGRGHVPLVKVELSRGDAVVGQPVLFIVDTGASFSFVPRSDVRELLEGLPEQHEQDSGARGANGSPLRGIPLDVNISLAGPVRLPPVRERIWVCRGIDYRLLGQTWLEKVGAHFQNFPENPRGRRFALYPSPYQTAADR